MGEQLNGVMMAAIKNQQDANGLIEKLLAVAQPGSIFSSPVTCGEHTVITASEVTVSMGYGFGTGGAGGDKQDVAVGEEAATPAVTQESGYGIGGGGGGYSGGRPVAVIGIGPEGVEVKPIVDETKIALAFFTALGSMFLMFRKMK
ncbi:MAG: hypothetical protein JXA33_29215 [Anaerolineae bacterium]|nr:hypothetical protein [Anaerolineae bacterium]